MPQRGKYDMWIVGEPAHPNADKYVEYKCHSFDSQVANCSRGLGANFVKFYVGDDGDEVAIHEKKLLEHSELFKKASNLPTSQLLSTLQSSRRIRLYQ